MSDASPIAPPDISTSADPVALLAASAGGTSLDPQSTLGIAQASQSPTDAFVNGRATDAYRTTLLEVNGLKKYTSDEQRNYWRTLSPLQQQMYQSAGYTPPKKHRGFFGSVLGDVGGAISAVGSVPGLGSVVDEAGHVVGDALHAMGSPLRNLQRVYRMGDMVSELEKERGNGGFWSLGTPSEWAQAWGMVKNGNSTFRPSSVARLTNEHGEQIVGYAKQLASGQSVEQIVSKVDPTQKLSLIQMLGSDEMKQTVFQLNNAKMSFGRDIVGEKFMDDHPALGKYLSGITDASADFFGDPLIVGGKFTKAMELAKYIVPAADTAEEASRSQQLVNQILTNTSGGQRFTQTVSDALTKMQAGDESAMASLARRYTHLDSVAPTMVKLGLDTPEDVANFYSHGEGLKAIIQGQASQFAPHNFFMRDRGVVVPHLSQLDVIGNSAKEIAAKTIDWSAEHHLPLAPSMRRLTRIANTDIVFDPFADDAVTKIRRTADYALGRSMKDTKYLGKVNADTVVGRFMSASTVGEKKNIYAGLLRTVMDGMGVSKEFQDDFFSTFDEVTRRAYGVNDQVSGAGPMGYLARHASHEWTIPSYKLLRNEADRVVVLKQLYGSVNADLVTDFMQKGWKPLQLLRMGFPIRTSLEELTGQALRDGPMGVVRSRLGASAVKGGDNPLSRAISVIGSHLPNGGAATTFDGLGATWSNAAATDEARNAFRELSDNATVTVYHGTTPENAAELARTGVVKVPVGHVSDLPTSATDHLYVAPTIRDAQRYGPAVVAVEVPKRSLLPSPEALRVDPNADNAKALFNSFDGATLPAGTPIKGTVIGSAEDAAKQQAAAFHGSVLADRTRRAFASVEGRLSGAKYGQAAREVAEMQPTGLAPEVSALTHRGAEMGASPADLQLAAQRGQKLGKLVLTASGPDFKGYAPGSEWYTKFWQQNILDHATDRFARPAIETMEQGRDAQVQAVTDYLSRDERLMQRTNEFYRNMGDRYGQKVGTDITQEQAFRDWAEVIVDNVNHLSSDPDGTRLPDVMRMMQKGAVDTKDAKTLLNIPDEMRPSSVVGPEKVALLGQSRYQDFVAHGFQKIGTAMDWMARQPMFVHNYAISKQEIEGFRPYFEQLADGNADVGEKLLRENAYNRAVQRTIPFIHDPAVRSQFAEEVKNLAPFQFAHEQFIKRWARTMYYSPDAFRKAQLTVSGMRHAGILHTDEQGNDYFIYPGAGAVQSVLQDGVKLLTGKDIKVPVPIEFTGQLRFTTPGTERLLAPSFGPVVGIPIHALANRFPELKELEKTVLGERGFDRSYWEQITPTTVSRLVHAMIDNPETSPQMHSAVLQAIQYLEANGHGLPEDASALQQEQYIDRIKSWSRIVMLNRAIFGFVVPAAPEPNFDPKNMNGQFRKLLSELPIDEAVKEMVRLNPNATPYTVFQSESAAHAPLPATKSALQFMTNHETFLKKYPEAGAWFLPQKPDTSGYDPVAYREQLALEMRQRKAPVQFYRDLKYTEAANIYFDTKAKKDGDLASAKGNPFATRAINQSWAQWKAGFLTSHPVFAEEIQSPDAHIRRQRTLDQLRTSFDDKSMPITPQVGAMQTLVRTYDKYLSDVAPLAGRADQLATNQRLFAKQSFIGWAHQFVADHPEVSPLYDRVFRWEIGDASDTGTDTAA